ncbi:unnamed protein product [Protopolystoma xenopodis]|uniref:Uncharacterized protein n=1 Tax=Protopolystoma xenopodis TaxID=117903 RepID=A0A3S5AAT5_9PLAT|nr:unnamed protein product [Protopolystoma xenopodis]
MFGVNLCRMKRLEGCSHHQTTTNWRCSTFEFCVNTTFTLTRSAGHRRSFRVKRAVLLCIACRTASELQLTFGKENGN